MKKKKKKRSRRQLIKSRMSKINEIAKIQVNLILIQNQYKTCTDHDLITFAYL